MHPYKDWIIYACGIYCIGFAIFHMFFWKLFRWKDELKKISQANRGILQIANIQLIALLCFIAYICVAYTAELHSTVLGRVVLLGCSGFWLIRTIQQFIFLRIKHRMVNILTILFIIGTVLFALPVLF